MITNLKQLKQVVAENNPETIVPTVVRLQERVPFSKEDSEKIRLDCPDDYPCPGDCTW